MTINENTVQVAAVIALIAIAIAAIVVAELSYRKFHKNEAKKAEEVRRVVAEAVGIAVGHGSMCWNPRPGDLVFDDQEAAKAVNAAVDRIMKLIE